MTAKVDYGVGITNAFELLEDETDESRVVAKTQTKGSVAKGKVEPSKRTTTQTAAPIARVEGRQDNRNQTRPRDNEQKNDRMGKAPKRDFVVGEERSPAPAQEPGMEGFSKVESRDRHGGHERRGAGRREGSIPGGRPGAKRQFDRRSGTGRGKEVSKGGAGKGGWGSDKGEAIVPESTTENQPQEEEGTEQVVQVAPPKEETPDEKEARLAREKEESYKLLDEYLEEKKKKAPALALPPPRTANEGSSQGQWNDFVPLQKTGESSIKLATIKKKGEKTADKKDEKKGEDKKEKKEKVSEELLGFHAPPRVQTDRRERGERRGGNKGPKTGPRKQGQPRGSEKAIEVNDEHFPSLATKA